MGNLPEPWLRGPLPQVHLVHAPALYAPQWLTVSQMLARPHGLAPLGFHLRHIAGSLVLQFRSSRTYSGDVGQRRALRRTLGPPPARQRETPPQREALPHTPTA